MTDIATRRAKMKKGKFAFEDLSEFLQQKVVKNSKIITLHKNRWIRLGRYIVFNKQIGNDQNDAYALLVVKPNIPLLNWLLLPLAIATDKGEWIIRWAKIPKTKYFLDIWEVGNDTESIALAAKAKP